MEMITIPQENTEYQQFKLSIPLKRRITGELGEFIVYQYLIRDQISNEVKFVIPWDAKLVNLYYGTPENISIPFQVIQLLKKVEEAIPNSALFDLLSYTCNPPKEIKKELGVHYRYYGCENVHCPLLLRKLQGILETEKTWGQIEDLSQIEDLIKEYNNRPRHYRDLSPEEKEQVMKSLPPPIQKAISADPEKFWIRNQEALLNSLSDNNKFNLIISDHQVKCEYLKSIQLIEVKAVTNKRPRIEIREPQINTLRYMSSMNFEINASYQILVVDLTNFNQMEFKISCLDNQKIIDAFQNGKRLTISYLKLIKEIIQ